MIWVKSVILASITIELCSLEGTSSGGSGKRAMKTTQMLLAGTLSKQGSDNTGIFTRNFHRHERQKEEAIKTKANKESKERQKTACAGYKGYAMAVNITRVTTELLDQNAALPVSETNVTGGSSQLCRVHVGLQTLCHTAVWYCCF